MNAYELADKLEWHWDNDCRSPAVSKSADMLRQQADLIAELESKLNGAAVVTGSVMTQLSTMAHPAKIFDEVLYTVQTFRENQDPPHKEWENTYMDGWLDACNEIYSAVFDLKEEMLELKESDSDAEDDDGRC